MVKFKRKTGLLWKGTVVKESAMDKSVNRCSCTSNRRQPCSLAVSVLLLLMVPIAQADGLSEDNERFELISQSQFCYAASKECFPLVQLPFSSEDQENQLDADIDVSDLGKVCLETVKTYQGDVQLEISYTAGKGWTMKDAHFWLGDDVNSAPVTVSLVQKGHKQQKHPMPDASRFPFSTRLEKMQDPALRTTTHWNELLAGNTHILCGTHPSDFRTGMRMFSGQAVLEPIHHHHSKTVVTAFASSRTHNNFRNLEKYFIACECPETPLESSSDSEDTELDLVPNDTSANEEGDQNEDSVEGGSDTDAENKAEEEEDTNHGTNSTETSSNTTKVDENGSEYPLIEADEESSDGGAMPTSDIGESGWDSSEDEARMNNTHAFNQSAPSMDKEDKEEKSENAETYKRAFDAREKIPNGQGASDSSSSSSDSYSESWDGFLEALTEEDAEDRPPVMVRADEIELTSSFIVVVPDQKHYIDVLLDEETLHKTEEKIEASPELHQAWRQFVANVMADNNIPAVNASYYAATHHQRTLKEAQMKPVTVEFLQDSPDLFKFLITTPCPSHVMDAAGSSAKALIRGQQFDDPSKTATCYKAFGKYKVLHINPEGVLENDDEFPKGQSRQEVCYDIFHFLREAFGKEKLGRELPDDVHFFTQGGKPESCLETGVSTVVPRPDDVEVIEPLLDSTDFADQHPKSILYELRNEDGTWNALRVMELLAYLSTTTLMMALCITIYCFLLPKIDMESRNRVTDDWSQVSLRPQPVVVRAKKKYSKTDTDYFPWLE